jgi:hypothetical protein
MKTTYFKVEKTLTFFWDLNLGVESDNVCSAGHVNVCNLHDMSMKQIFDTSIIYHFLVGFYVAPNSSKKDLTQN